MCQLKSNEAEYNRAGQVSGLLKNMFGPWSQTIGGRHLKARLMRPLMKIVQSDTRHAPGERCPADGDLEHLEGFEFNENQQPKALGDVRCSLLRSPKSDQVLVKTDAFVADVFLTPELRRATHFKVALLVAAIPAVPWGRKKLFKQDTGSILVGQRAIPSLQALVDLVINEAGMLYCAALAVSFFRFSGSRSRPLNNGRQDQLRVLKVFSA
jgi:hypothetical protein